MFGKQPTTPPFGTIDIDDDRDIEVYTSPALVEVVVHADEDIDLELWGLRRKRELFERVFGCRLEVVDAQLAFPLEEPGRALSR